MNLSKKRIILSKTNRIGDVVVSLPVASMLKKIAPDCYIIMLVTNYTKMLAERYRDVDEYICWDDTSTYTNPVDSLKKLNADIIIHLRGRKDIAKSAKLAGIPLRVGATNRLYNWLYCNKRYKVNRTRHSPYHDAQLDMQLVLPIINQSMPTQDDIAKLMHFNARSAPLIDNLIDKGKFNLILHPKSVTDAGKREWPIENFKSVIKALDPKLFKIFITGTEADGKLVREYLCKPFSHVCDLTGKLSLDELTILIQSADGLVAGSTGPLHIAAAMGIHALGLYTPVLGHNPTRWGPIGQRAEYLITDKTNCNACKKNQACPCIRDITPNQVISRLLDWNK